MPQLDEKTKSLISLVGMLGFCLENVNSLLKINGFLLQNCFVHGIDSCLNFSLYKMALAIVNLVFKELQDLWMKHINAHRVLSDPQVPVEEDQLVFGKGAVCRLPFTAELVNRIMLILRQIPFPFIMISACCSSYSYD